MTGSESLALFGLLSHCQAMLEPVTVLIRDRRAMEALTIGARIFEQSTVLRWLADHQDELGDWFEQWQAASAHDLAVLAKCDLETGRRPTGKRTFKNFRRESQLFLKLRPLAFRRDWIRDRAIEQGRQRL